MPSNNKRKLHGLHSQSSNGEVPLKFSADNRLDIIVNGELMDRKHLSNGKENLLTEALPVARASCKNISADTPSHCDILARTSDDGVPAENSCLAQTTQNCVNDHGGLGHGMVMGKRENGNNKHLSLNPACAHVNNRQHSDSETIANLKQLNKKLVEQVCSLRSENSLLREKLESLKVKLEQMAMREETLLVEKALLENEKAKFELELKSNTQEVAKLGLEKLGLLEAMETLVAANHGLQRDGSECKEKVQEANEKLKVSIDALALAGEQVHYLEAEMELLRFEQHRLNEEVLLLQKKNADLHFAMKDLKMEKEHLEGELKSIQTKYANAEERIAETSLVKEALEAKLANRSLQGEGFQMQLEGAWKQIQSLEAQLEASMAERFDLERQIKQLENALAAARDECEETFCKLELEREEKISLRTTLGKAERMSEALQNEFDTMTISTANLQFSADYSQQQIISLEAKVASLLKERAALETTKALLKEELEHLETCSDEAFVSSKQEIDKLKEKVCALEEALESTNMQTLKESESARGLSLEAGKLSTSFKQRKWVADVSVPMAVVSTGSLVVLGIMFVWRRGK